MIDSPQELGQTTIVGPSLPNIPWEEKPAGCRDVVWRSNSATGRIAIYYGGADTVVCLAFAQADELLDFIKSNSL